MKKKIEVQICTGTTCYVMGASDILTLEDYLPEALKDSVEISGATCLGLCKTDYSAEGKKSSKKYKPPFVKVCGKLIERASLDKVLEAVNAEYNGGKYAYTE